MTMQNFSKVSKLSLIMLLLATSASCSIPGRVKNKVDNGVDKIERKIADTGTQSAAEYMSDLFNIEIQDDEILIDYDESFAFESEGIVVAQIDKQRIEKIPTDQPPFDTWKNGPFSEDPKSYVENIYKKTDQPEIVSDILSGDLTYALNEHCCENLRWHTATVLLVDKSTSQIAVIYWDY